MEPEIHPLSIPGILERVFKNIIIRSQLSSDAVLEEVKRLRLVSTTWRDEATQLYRRARAPTKFYRRSSLKRFLRIMADSEIIPVNKYILHFPLRLDQDKKLLKRFFTVCGPDTVHLTIGVSDNTRTKQVYLLRSYHAYLANNLRMLQKLEFIFLAEDTWHNVKARGMAVAGFLEIGLRAATGLREFSFICCEKPVESLMKHFEASISRGLQRNRTVRRLFLHDLRLTDIFFRTVTPAGLELTELEFNSYWVSGNKIIFHFLQPQTYSLKKLIIGRSSWPTSCKAFPPLIQLIQLKCWIKPFSNFSFRDTFPMLNSLDMTCEYASSDLVPSFTEMRVPSTSRSSLLERITLPSRGNYKGRSFLYKKISAYFPNIREVHICPFVCFERSLQEVFLYFRNIERLHITWPGHLSTPQEGILNVDSVLTGISAEECRAIGRDPSPLNAANRLEHAVRIMPSILNLTNLTSLSLLSTDNDDRLILTDISARVFLQMPNLRRLFLSQAMISIGYIQDLQANEIILNGGMKRP